MSQSEPSTTNSSSTSTGKFAVMGMLLVAVLAAMFAWWWNFNQRRESLRFFGSQGANLVRTAPVVEILVPLVDEPKGESTGEAMRRYGVHAVRRIDVSKARGLIHARTALLNDSSYNRTLPKTKHATAYFIRFSDPSNEVLLGFTEPDGSIELADTGECKHLIQKTADGWRSFIKRNVDATAGGTKPPEPGRTGPSE